MVTFPFSARSIKNFPVIYYNNIEEPWRQTHWHLGFPCDVVPLPSFTLELVYIKPSAVYQWPTVRALPGTGSHRGFYPVELWGSDTELQIEGATVDLVASLLTVRLTFLFLQLPVSQTVIMDSEEKYSQAEAWKEGLSSCQGELSYLQGPRISRQYSEHRRLDVPAQGWHCTLSPHLTVFCPKPWPYWGRNPAAGTIDGVEWSELVFTRGIWSE